jgi:hypothetical protein
LNQLWVFGAKFFFAATVTGFLGLKHLQNAQLFTPFFVVGSKYINLLFIHRYRVEQLAVRGLPSEELLHDLLDIVAAGRCTDFLESVFNFKVALHDLLHFCLKEGRPELLSQEVLLHLELI